MGHHSLHWDPVTRDQIKLLSGRAALSDPRCELRTIDKSCWPEELDLMRRALNKGMRDEWEFQQYEREETLELFGPSKAIWDPRMMVFAEVDGGFAGVAVGWPDWTRCSDRSTAGRARSPR